MFIFKQNKIKTKKCNFNLDLKLQSDKKENHRKNYSVMNSAQTVIDQELAQFGWVESIATNSISDFNSPRLNNLEQTIDVKKSDLIDTFIYHLVFYVIFCYSLFLYVFIDLGFGSFLGDQVTRLIKLKEKVEIPSHITTLFH